MDQRAPIFQQNRGTQRAGVLKPENPPEPKSSPLSANGATPFVAVAGWEVAGKDEHLVRSLGRFRVERPWFRRGSLCSIRCFFRGGGGFRFLFVFLSLSLSMCVGVWVRVFLSFLAFAVFWRGRCFLSWLFGGWVPLRRNSGEQDAIFTRPRATPKPPNQPPRNNLVTHWKSQLGRT